MSNQRVPWSHYCKCNIEYSAFPSHRSLNPWPPLAIPMLARSRSSTIHTSLVLVKSFSIKSSVKTMRGAHKPRHHTVSNRITKRSFFSVDSRSTLARNSISMAVHVLWSRLLGGVGLRQSTTSQTGWSHPTRPYGTKVAIHLPECTYP